MIYTGERLIPEQFGIGDRLLIEHLDRYRFASRAITQHFVSSRHQLRILDAPCGAGYGAALLAEQTGARVVGIDNDEQTIEHAQQRYDSVPGLEFRVFDLDTDEFTDDFTYGDYDEYDAVVCFEGIEHVQHQFAVARKLSRVVASRGLVIVSTPRRDGPGAGSVFHTKELVQSEFRDLFFPHVRSMRMIGQDIVVGDCQPDNDARFYVLVGVR